MVEWCRQSMKTRERRMQVDGKSHIIVSLDIILAYFGFFPLERVGIG